MGELPDAILSMLTVVPDTLARGVERLTSFCSCCRGSCTSVRTLPQRCHLVSAYTFGGGPLSFPGSVRRTSCAEPPHGVKSGVNTMEGID